MPLIWQAIITILGWLARTLVVRLVWLWQRVGGQAIFWIKGAFSRFGGMSVFLCIMAFLQWRMSTWLIHGALGSVFNHTSATSGVSGGGPSLWSTPGEGYAIFSNVLGCVDYVCNISAWVNAVTAIFSIWTSAIIVASFNRFVRMGARLGH